MRGNVAGTCCSDKNVCSALFLTKATCSRDMKRGQNHNICTHENVKGTCPRECCNDMSLCVNWYFFLAQHQFGGYFVPVTYHTKFNWYTSRAQNIARKPWHFVYITVMKHVPATESKVEPIRDNDQNSFCSCTGTKTRRQHGVALSFSCMPHRIGLSLKRAISIRVWLFIFQEIWPLSVFSRRIILNRFYFDGRHLTSTM